MSARLCCLCPRGDFQFHHFLLQQTEAPFRASCRRHGTGKRYQFGFLLAIEDAGYRRPLLGFAPQCRVEPLFDQPLASLVNRRGARLQGLHDAAVASGFTGPGGIGLKKYPYLQGQAGGWDTLMDDRLKRLALSGIQLAAYQGRCQRITDHCRFQ